MAHDHVLPARIIGRVAVEQASTLGWDRYVGIGGAIIGMHSYGASAPAPELLKRFGFTPEATLAAARKQAARPRADKAGGHA